MFNYVEMNTDIYLGYIIICFWHLYITKHNLYIFTSKRSMHFICKGNHNIFQYYFVAIRYSCFVIISETLFQIITSEKKWRRKITVKIHLPTTITQCWIPPRKSFNWIDAEMKIGQVMHHIHIFSLNNLYESLHRRFTFYLTWFIAAYWENWSLTFALKEGEIAYLKIRSNLSPTK